MYTLAHESTTPNHINSIPNIRHTTWNSQWLARNYQNKTRCRNTLNDAKLFTDNIKASKKLTVRIHQTTSVSVNTPDNAAAAAEPGHCYTVHLFKNTQVSVWNADDVMECVAKYVKTANNYTTDDRLVNTAVLLKQTGSHIQTHNSYTMKYTVPLKIF